MPKNAMSFCRPVSLSGWGSGLSGSDPSDKGAAFS